MRSKPRWSLERVKTLVATGKFAMTHSACDRFPTRSDALAAAADVIRNLRPADFAHTAILPHHIADVYGVSVHERGWYLKLAITEDAQGRAVLLISFHPLDRPLKTRKGVVYP
jgi:Motility quorum-sensing regulator, toxin of MqsA